MIICENLRNLWMGNGWLDDLGNGRVVIYHWSNRPSGMKIKVLIVDDSALFSFFDDSLNLLNQCGQIGSGKTQLRRRNTMMFDIRMRLCAQKSLWNDVLKGIFLAVCIGIGRNLPGYVVDSCGNSD